jgi:hypothetical protein
MAELTFGPLLNSEGGNLGPITTYPSIPSAQSGFQIQWADANVDWSSGAGPYTDTVWITDDNRKDAQGNPLLLWVQAINLPGLAPQQSESRTISVPAGSIPASRCTIHVYIDSQGQVPEWDFTDASNYTYNSMNITY